MNLRDAANARYNSRPAGNNAFIDVNWRELVVDLIFFRYKRIGAGGGGESNRRSKLTDIDKRLEKASRFQSFSIKRLLNF